MVMTWEDLAAEIQANPDAFIDERDRRRLAAFARRMFPGYLTAPHIQQLVAALEWAAVTPNARLIVTMPPRHSKSLHVSELFPAWYLGRFPNNRIIAASHSASLAYTFSRRVRNLVNNDRYPFPGVEVADDKGAVQAWDIQGTRGGYLSVGVGGSPTGVGGNCLIGDTNILTYNGYVSLSRLVHTGGLVLGIDHETSMPVWRPIEATRIVGPKGIYELITKSGRRIRGTGEHLVFVEGSGYRPLSQLERGDVLVGVRPVRSHIPAAKIRNSESREAGRGRIPVLLKEMCLDASQSEGARQVLHGMPRTNSAKSGEVLLRPLRDRGGRAAKVGKIETMPDVRYAVSPEVTFDNILLQELRRCGTLGTDARQTKRELQRRNELFQVVSVNATIDSGTRSFTLRRVREAGRYSDIRAFRDECTSFGASDSPYQSGPVGQCAGESDNTLQDVSWQAPQIERDTVAVVRDLRESRECVYDIQVAGCRNFFADGILVHNCIIIDDPLRSSADAESETIREGQIEWYQGTIRTRLEPGGSIVLTATRWHDADLTGWLLDQQAKGGEQWRHLHFPALDDDNQPLWPEHWPLAQLERIKASVGSRAWQAQYQGDPQPLDGGMLKRHWWQRYRAFPEHVSSAIITVDSAFKTGVAADYSVAALWGMVGTDAYLLNVWRNRVEFPDLLRMGYTAHTWASERLPHVRSIPLVVEDKASGQSAIQQWKADRTIPVIPYPIPAGVSKESRVDAISSYVEAGKAYIPDETLGGWPFDVEAWLHEHDRFPFSDHDDQVDSTAMALDRLLAPNADGYFEPVPDGYLDTFSRLGIG